MFKVALSHSYKRTAVQGHMRIEPRTHISKP